jgi:hypothetical protein
MEFSTSALRQNRTFASSQLLIHLGHQVAEMQADVARELVIR